MHKRTRSEGNRDIPRSKNRKKLKRLSTNWIPYSLIPKKKRRNMGRRGLCKIDVPDQINRRTAGPSTVNTSLSLQGDDVIVVTIFDAVYLEVNIILYN